MDCVDEFSFFSSPLRNSFLMSRFIMDCSDTGFVYRVQFVGGIHREVGPRWHFWSKVHGTTFEGAILKPILRMMLRATSFPRSLFVTTGKEERYRELGAEKI